MQKNVKKATVTLVRVTDGLYKPIATSRKQSKET